MTRIVEIADRLHRLAKRREDEGIYTDAALCEEAAAYLSAALAAEPGEAVAGHKWLDPECGVNGCQSLVWKARYESAVSSLPLKEEVERVLERFASSAQALLAYHNPGDLPEDESQQWQSVERQISNARSLLSRIRAGAQEGWRSQAAHDVLAERKRQVEVEGWTPEHDDSHSNGELAAAASCYAYSSASVRKLVPSRWATGRSIDDDDIPVGRTDVPANWPDWDGDWWKPSEPRRNLVKAGALILAEIERLDRAAPSPEAKGGPRP